MQCSGFESCHDTLSPPVPDSEKKHKYQQSSQCMTEASHAAMLLRFVSKLVLSCLFGVKVCVEKCVSLDRWFALLSRVLIALVSTHLSPSCAGVRALLRRWSRCWMSPGFHFLRSGAHQFAPLHILETRTFHFSHKGPFFSLIWILVNKSC